MASKILDSTINIPDTGYVLPSTVITVILARDIDFHLFSKTVKRGFMTNLLLLGDADILTNDTLVLDFLEQAGITQRLNLPGTTDVAIMPVCAAW